VIAILLIGFLFGFVGSIPVAGPISALVLGRALDARYREGLAIAVGAALAESIYAALAFWGVGALLAAHPWLDPASRLVAGGVLLALGVAFLRYRPDPHSPQPVPTGRKTRGFLLGFWITALNPTLIATWTAATATLASTGFAVLTPNGVVPFAAAACLGILCWFTVMLATIRRLAGGIGARKFQRLLPILGTVLVFAGGMVAVSSVGALVRVWG
jgi:threonine/homoserine/homoserine lactone efflux protein